jgi:hypothetical protein
VEQKGAFVVYLKHFYAHCVVILASGIFPAQFISTTRRIRVMYYVVLHG